MVMSTSFGMQSAVLLHMATRIFPDIKVVWIDTGYLHTETYHFAKHLTRRLNLNLHVYQSDMSAARMEALHGQLWAKDDNANRVYGVVRKVEPMTRALSELRAVALLSGVRGGQTDHRKSLGRLTYVSGQRHYRIHPLLHWSAADVDAYIAQHGLPYHPLKRRGYVSIGDAHSSRPKSDGDVDDRATRFHGARQECGLHTETGDAAALQDLRDEACGDRRPRDDAPDEPKPPLHGTNAGIEIYGRANCRFCQAAKRVLEAKSIDFRWCTLQRFNQAAGQLEPPTADGVTVVNRDTVASRIDSMAPGLPPFETVPQIFKDGAYLGGFTELCVDLNVPKTVMDVALLDIGSGADNVDAGWAHTWNEQTSNLRPGPAAVLVRTFSDPAANDLAPAAMMRQFSEPIVDPAMQVAALQVAAQVAASRDAPGAAAQFQVAAQFAAARDAAAAPASPAAA